MIGWNAFKIVMCYCQFACVSSFRLSNNNFGIIKKTPDVSSNKFQMWHVNEYNNCICFFVHKYFHIPCLLQQTHDIGRWVKTERVLKINGLDSHVFQNRSVHNWPLITSGVERLTAARGRPWKCPPFHHSNLLARI